MTYVKFLPQSIAMESFIIGSMKGRIDDIQLWGRVLALANDAPTVDAVEEVVKFIRLIREPTIVVENILSFASLLMLGGWANRLLIGWGYSRRS